MILRASLLLALSSVFAGQVTAAETLAEVNGDKITASMLEIYAMQRGAPNMAAVSGEQRQRLIKELIDRELLYRIALKDKLENNPEAKKELDSAHRNILASFVIKGLSTGKNAITDDVLKKEFNEYVKTLGNSEYKARHVLLEKEDQAKDVISQLDKGGDFQALAKEKSQGPSGPAGGDLGWFRPEQMLPAFSVAVKALGKGKYTKTPVKTDYGWHVILLEDSRVIDPPAFSSIKEQLSQKVLNDRIGAYLLDLRKNAKIEMK